MAVVASNPMKALLFMPFAFAAGAEGFALFVPYLLVLLAALHLGRTYRPYGKLFRKLFRAVRVSPRLMSDVMPEPHPVL